MQSTVTPPTIVVTVGGDPLTGANAQRWTVSAATVDGSEAIILSLIDTPDVWVAVREDSVSLDFLVRVLVQERLDALPPEAALSPPPSPPPPPKNECDAEMGSCAGVRIELAQVMEHPHVLRQEVLSDRKAIFSVVKFVSDFGSSYGRRDTVPAPVPGAGAAETTTTSAAMGSSLLPMAGDWPPVEEQSGGGGDHPIMNKVWDVGRWVSSRVGATIAPNPDKEVSSTTTTTARNNGPILPPAAAGGDHGAAAAATSPPPSKGEDQWYQPYVDVLLNHHWYLVSMREYRCGQCESMNPLRAALQLEICNAMAAPQHHQRQPEGGAGLQAGAIGPVQAEKLVRAMRDTAPALFIVATAYHRLVQAVDALLVDENRPKHKTTTTQEKDEEVKNRPGPIKSLEELRGARAFLYEARQAFFYRRGLLSTEASSSVVVNHSFTTTDAAVQGRRDKGKEKASV